MSIVRRHRTSAPHAKERLASALAQDRTGISTAELALLRADVLEAVGRYFVVGRRGARVLVLKDGRKQRFVAEFTVSRAKARRRNL